MLVVPKDRFGKVKDGPGWCTDLPRVIQNAG